MFYTQTFRRNRANNTNFNRKGGEFFILTEDDWDDYGYETTFWLDLWKDNMFYEIGLIRILNSSETRTRSVIPKKFESLDNDFIALGYSEKLYKKMIELLGKERSKETLYNLNDISIIGLQNSKFKLDDKGIQDSFFRSSDGRFLYSEVKNKYFLDIEIQDRDYNFIFKAKLYSDSNDFKDINIDFRKRDNYLPNRLFTIVGKNGVGKTRFLNQLAESLFDSSKQENKNLFLNIQNTETSDLNENIPIYNKIIAISFSVFDKFYKGSTEKKKDSPKSQQSVEDQTKFNNYTYIGLHKKDNSIYTSDELIEINKRAFKKIIENERQDLFIESINSSDILNFKLEKNFDYIKFFEEIFSSGQSIFISMLCRLLSEIEDGSLIFLDEPELYLHPNAISNLARIYYDILDQFKSYAILCTHSPILVQEIPSKYVRKLFITDNNTIHYTRPNIETFGTNISEITADIFNVLDNESLYKSQIIDWSKNKDLNEEQILELFDIGLSFKTQLFISSIFSKESK